MTSDASAVEHSHRARALALLDQQPARLGDGSSRKLSRVCHAVTAYLDVVGAAITVAGDEGPDAVAASTDERVRRLVELQFTTGEGPCLDAHRDARPVLVPDLVRVDRARWPGYLSLAVEAGLGAVFALPMHVGAVRLGVLDIFALRATRLSAEQIGTALAFSRIATETVLDGVGGAGATGNGDTADGQADDVVRLPVALESLDYRAEVFQAQGMLMIMLDVGLVEALLRMRAHAFAHSQPLGNLAHDIVGGRTFDPGDI